MVAKTAEALRTRYVFPDIGERAAARIEAGLAAGAYKDLSQPRAFADQLTAHLYETTKDKHVQVFAPGPAPPSTPAPPPRPRSEGGIVRADRLHGNIGYIEIARFPGPAVFNPVIDRAIASLNDVSAVILDLRRNNGGSAASDAYLVSHFVDPKKRWPSTALSGASPARRNSPRRSSSLHR